MTSIESSSKNSWSFSTTVGVLLFTLIIIYFAYGSGVSEIIRRWVSEDEYGHGPLLVLLSLYFYYQKRDEIINTQAKYSNAGIIIITVASLLLITGEISSLYLLVHYSFICAIYGFIVCIYGVGITRHIIPSLLLLFFSIPIPYFLQTELTINLQLISSWIGVFIIRLFSIPVFLEGNVIDLGIMKLQVVEACAGLRYMFSLLSFGFICAYVYHVAMWKRILIFASTIPITILMNSVRIAVVGILVNKVGIEMADGFTHYFQGVSIFAICLLLLFFEMWLLTKIGSQKTAFREVFGFDFSQDQKKQPATSYLPTINSIFVIGLIIFTIATAGTISFEQREESIPERTPLVHFPSSFGSWEGNNQKLDKDVLQKLKLDDYISADYRQRESNIPVNFYVAYYESQRKGASPHSPRVCIPGGGWEISDISRRKELLLSNNKTLAFNRAIIKKGNSTQLVYYWFQQRGLSISNEYLMKWYLFRDALIKNRTDGALVRLVTPLLPHEKLQAADDRLIRFANDTTTLLNQYIPN